jgi:DNA-binding transcriptional MocR family regulator
MATTRHRQRVDSEARHEPVYQRLADLLAGFIEARALQPGDRVPSVRAFSRQQRVSVPTALHAYATLEARGLIEARPKAGFYVRARRADTLREPGAARQRPRVTNFADLDPNEAVMTDLSDPSLVPLGAAVPSPDLLPVVALNRTMAAIARRIGGASVAYDTAPGSEQLRRILARRSLEWGGRLAPEEFVVTNGCTEALALALQATCRPGDTVLVEAPTYFGIASMLRERGLRALPIPVDSATGLDPDRVAEAVRRTRIAACVLVANFLNPVGCLIPDGRKRALVLMLAERGIPIIEDDIYGDLQHEGPRPRCLKADDPDGSVLLCGSFSKTLAPGYRVGYIAAGRWHDRVLALKRSQTLANATLPVLAVADFLRNGGYDRYLRRVRRAYRDQVSLMREAVAEAFPEGVAISRPQGGVVLWCEIPGVDAMELFRRARAQRISIAPGPLFGPQGGFEHCIRINCGHPWSEKIARSVRTLGRIARELTARGRRTGDPAA